MQTDTVTPRRLKLFWAKAKEYIKKQSTQYCEDAFVEHETLFVSGEVKGDTLYLDPAHARVENGTLYLDK